LKMSRCFIRSAESTDSSTALRPYRNGLTCVTCHNPHVSVKETGKAVFNSACMHCHDAKKNELDCSASQAQRKLSGDNCVSCHMPRSGSVDIPHVTVHDHFIRKPQTVADSKALKKFIGLYAVNDDHPDRATRAQGFVSYYEKFDPTNRSLLDSAMAYLPSNSTNDIRSNLSGLVQLKFLQHDFQGIKNLIVQAGKDWLMTKGLVHADWANADAWTAYRIGEAYTGLGDAPQALDYYRRATKLASFNLDFENKLAVALMELQKEGEAEKVLNFILSEDNRNVPAYTNLSRLYFLKGDIKNAETYCDKALALDPDHVPALKNKTDCLNAQNKFLEAKTLLQRILKKHPEDADAKTLLLKMKSLKLIS
jgi:tetratricopeptide (TPR) repeat protein